MARLLVLSGTNGCVENLIGKIMSLYFQSIPGNEGKFFWFELQAQNGNEIRVWRVEESIAFHLGDSKNDEALCQVPALEHQVVARILFCATLIDVCIQIICLQIFDKTIFNMVNPGLIEI
jgi:hypothetical protein